MTARRIGLILLGLLLLLLLSGCLVLGPGPHGRSYHYPPGAIAVTLPLGYVTITAGGHLYYYHRGVYYRHTRAGYVVVTAPLGARITALPYGAVEVIVEAAPYHYFEGAFYVWLPTRRVYEVIEAPRGATVPYLPRGSGTVYVDGRRYYRYDRTYFEPDRREGRRTYRVVRPPLGRS